MNNGTIGKHVESQKTRGFRSKDDLKPRINLRVPTIHNISGAEARSIGTDLLRLLRDAVEDGASVGFLLPLSIDRLQEYWEETCVQIETGKRILLVSKDGNQITGSVQLELVSKENGLHRAEVQKLLVDTRFRNRGIASALMSEVESVARGFGRTLLVLDTLQGSTAEKLYEKWGYNRAGAIPDYARVSDNSLHPTVVFFKRL